MLHSTTIKVQLVGLTPFLWDEIVHNRTFKALGKLSWELLSRSQKKDINRSTWWYPLPSSSSSTISFPEIGNFHFWSICAKKLHQYHSPRCRNPDIDFLTIFLLPIIFPLHIWTRYDSFFSCTVPSTSCAFSILLNTSLLVILTIEYFEWMKFLHGTCLHTTVCPR